ncbi:fumarylacetoacetate hydrolase family protein [Myxococcus sp. CA051A]|uniref:Fumarylacetoacetate hydrolase family protein n=1 Tax=Myxococcus llanfairpwllgwyngyllgogerychwyrndrobwllllantysiliogogogochensis TaxID=2590453 RepID=A0A540WLD2_9BACT|nr:MULTISPECIES: fumarylacetoacetate hydrolase family protein [Myxococcus]NTX03448.1 fumarylacetoacetate hydrolase family protein [Myxococcus sp. CA040A]NTX34044.1 fumarylacetoacetate hydrolase family protein [Myxococcus sp. CA033]NTX55438.1 fumarylacetoacetate hydrolase family protein [Myxococcus sp. CA039A]NTX65769.1 fumarylacetoacetate hydrolase family protein [Myxococcus sp. CA051A]TQF09840.1 fumarylacetoacetate hydrolase family protein [Myxococcus llanfairpwllgwyngyllgogerychwyrndrobwllll
MKLATLKDGTRDGRLIVVKRDNSAYALATNVALTLQAALDDWDTKEPLLRALAAQLEAGAVQSRPLDQTALHAPLPRAYEWIDGSAYINHVMLVRKARNAEPPATLKTDPLVYQGGSGDFLAPTADIPLADEAWGLDFESEVCVILGDTPQGTKAADAGKHVKLLMLANDVSLRNLIPDELAKGFGFFQSKPATAFSPFAVTPDEVGPAWREGRIHLRLRSVLNGVQVGDTDAGPEMHFSFFELIQHLCKTRGYTAGTILGSGTVSNVDRARGISCLAEQRMIETIEEGKPKTPFMKPGDTIDIEMMGEDGQSVFGRISQKVVKPS